MQSKLPVGLVVIFLMVIASACAAPSAEEQDKNWTGPSGLLDTSDRIVSAQFIEARVETVSLVDDTNSEIVGEERVLFRQFEVTETFKGTSDSGDTMWVAFESGVSGELVDGEGSVRDFETGPSYLLFLKGRLRPIEYPADYGAVLWTGNGEPSFAIVSGDDLRFVSERGYLELLQREGRELPDPTSAAPFELTISGIREATD